MQLSPNNFEREKTQQRYSCQVAKQIFILPNYMKSPLFLERAPQ